MGSPILAGVAGTVHVGMDTDLIALKIQRAIGRQVYLISIILVIGVLAAIWFINLAAKPLGDLLAYAVTLARDRDNGADDKLLARDDEVGQLARLFLYFSEGVQAEGEPRVSSGNEGVGFDLGGFPNSVRAAREPGASAPDNGSLVVAVDWRLRILGSDETKTNAAGR